MGSWGITMRESDYGTDLLDFLILQQLKKRFSPIPGSRTYPSRPGFSMVCCRPVPHPQGADIDDIDRLSTEIIKDFILSYERELGNSPWVFLPH